MPELGRAALVVCLGLSLYATVAGAIAAHERRRRLAVSAQNALIAALGAAAVASAVLLTALLLVAVASPFATQAAPADGLGLNPSLQNPYMVIHPPMLYLGYVGLTVPFAFAMGALLSGRTDERWIV